MSANTTMAVGRFPGRSTGEASALGTSAEAAVTAAVRAHRWSQVWPGLRVTPRGCSPGLKPHRDLEKESGRCMCGGIVGSCA